MTGDRHSFLSDLTSRMLRAALTLGAPVVAVALLSLLVVVISQIPWAALDMSARFGIVAGILLCGFAVYELWYHLFGHGAGKKRGG